MTVTHNLPERLHFIAPMAHVLDPDRHPTYDVIADRINQAFKAERGRQARCAEALMMDPGDLRNHLKRRFREVDERTGAVVKAGMMLDLDQVAVIASTIGAPRGWPALSWRQAEAFEKFLELTQETRGRT